MNTVISEEEYKELLKKYLEEQGPNPGTGMFGCWAWKVSKEKEFQKTLAKEGYKKVDTPDSFVYNKEN